MVLAVEIGNTHISLGGFDGDDCKFVAPIATAPKRTGVEIAWELKGVFSLFGLQANQFHAAIVGSVVPTMTAAVIQGAVAFGHRAGVEPFFRCKDGGKHQDRTAEKAG